MQIIDGIKSGCEPAAQYAINKYARLAWHISSAVLKNVASAEDVEECVADVFVYLWQNADKFNPDRGDLKSWLSAIAKSKAIDRFRILSKSQEVELNDDILLEKMNILDDIITGECKRELISAINALADIDREIILRKYYYNQKGNEIAFALDCSVKQIENRLYYAKQKLRKTLIYEN